MAFSATVSDEMEEINIEPTAGSEEGSVELYSGLEKAAETKEETA